MFVQLEEKSVCKAIYSLICACVFFILCRFIKERKSPIVHRRYTTEKRQSRWQDMYGLIADRDMNGLNADKDMYSLNICWKGYIWFEFLLTRKCQVWIFADKEMYGLNSEKDMNGLNADRDMFSLNIWWKGHVWF